MTLVLAGKVPLLTIVALLTADVVLLLAATSRGCCPSTIYGFPGRYGKPRFSAPSDGPRTVVVSIITTSSVVVTVSVTVGFVVIVILKEGILSVSVEGRVAGFVVVSFIGRVVTTDVAETFETMVTVIWGGIV